MSRNKHYKQKKYKPVLICKRKATQEEREQFERVFQKEHEKYIRDIKCGFVR